MRSEPIHNIQPRALQDRNFPYKAPDLVAPTRDEFAHEEPSS